MSRPITKHELSMMPPSYFEQQVVKALEAKDVAKAIRALSSAVGVSIGHTRRERYRSQIAYLETKHNVREYRYFQLEDHQE